MASYKIEPVTERILILKPLGGVQRLHSTEIMSVANDIAHYSDCKVFVLPPKLELMQLSDKDLHKAGLVRVDELKTLLEEDAFSHVEQSISDTGDT